MITVAASLGSDDVAAVLALVAAARSVDGGDPLAEDALLALRGTAPAAPGDSAGTGRLLHLLDWAGGSLRGYAQARTAPLATTVELLVHPAARGQGTGRALAERLRGELGASSPVQAWSHTDSPAAAALAAALGLRRSRELWRMELRLPAQLPPLQLPDGVVVRPFEPGRDEDAWLHLNARAFAGHPEQGAWVRADLDARMAEPWFDPAGLLLALDAGSTADARTPSRLLAAHWTKVTAPGRGQVYVLAVDPAAQGRGLGTVMALAGLHHLAERGAVAVDLYVEGDNTAAQRTYTRLGFVAAATDVVYLWEPAAP